MFVLNDRPISIMVMYAVILHLIWALLILFDPSALGATPLDSLYRYIHSPLQLSLILAVVAFVAAAGSFARMPVQVLALVPQQIVLMMTAAGSIEAIWLAQYADGVFRPRTFMLADQANSILAACGHTIAIIAHVKRLAR